MGDATPLTPRLGEPEGNKTADSRNGEKKPFISAQLTRNTNEEAHGVLVTVKAQLRLRHGAVRYEASGDDSVRLDVIVHAHDPTRPP